ncbi:MAG: hypothetical protein P8100_09215 [bacterium]
MIDFQKILFFLLLFISTDLIHAQQHSMNGFSEDETILYTMNKQVGQFVKRFNMEEDQYGKTLAETDERYHDNQLRKKLLPGMFDKSNPRTSSKLKEYFVDDVTREDSAIYLNFLDKNWYAEVATTFLADGAEVHIILYLTLEQEKLGSKWVISNAWYSYFPSLFKAPDSAEQVKFFLHPMSHELDFMNLHKALERPEQIQYYASKNYRPDYLSLFFYQMKTGKLEFKHIDDVKFHFFQIPGWYCELSYFNRSDTNSGWLISNLIYVNEKEKKELIKSYHLCASKDLP